MGAGESKKDKDGKFQSLEAAKNFAIQQKYNNFEILEEKWNGNFVVYKHK